MSGTHLNSNGWRGRLQSNSAPVGSNRWNCENCLEVSSRSSAIVATCGEEGGRAVVSVCMPRGFVTLERDRGHLWGRRWARRRGERVHARQDRIWRTSAPNLEL